MLLGGGLMDGWMSNRMGSQWVIKYKEMDGRMPLARLAPSLFAFLYFGQESTTIVQCDI